MTLKGNLRRIDMMSVVAHDGEEFLFDMPLSFHVVGPEGKPADTNTTQQVKAGFMISAKLIDKCSLYVLTGRFTTDPWYRIKLGSYLEKQ